MMIQLTPQQISERIQSAMDSAGLSARDVQNLTGISKSAIQRYTSGTTLKIPMDRVQLIAKACGVSAASLLGWDVTQERCPNGQKRLLDAFRALTPDQQQSIIIQVEALAQMQRGPHGAVLGQSS